MIDKGKNATHLVQAALYLYRLLRNPTVGTKYDKWVHNLICPILRNWCWNSWHSFSTRLDFMVLRGEPTASKINTYLESSLIWMLIPRCNLKITNRFRFVAFSFNRISLFIGLKRCLNSWMCFNNQNLKPYRKLTRNKWMHIVDNLSNNLLRLPLFLFSLVIAMKRKICK